MIVIKALENNNTFLMIIIPKAPIMDILEILEAYFLIGERGE